MNEIPTIDDVRAAADRIAGHAVRTPLLSSRMLDELTGARILIKPENLQRTGSFKFRGAYNAIAALSPAERARGVVAVSSGNHAQGVAEAARLFAIAATIIMPSDAPAVKRRRTERSGARVIAYDRATDDRDTIAADLIAQHGGTLIHPYNNADVIAGQGTIGLEVVADCDALGVSPSVIAVPCGGGGLSSGINIAMSDAYPGVRVTLVEPENFDDYRRSLREGRIVRNATSGGSVCDALMAQAPGAIGYSINSRGNANAVTVSDSEALAAVAFAFRELKLVVEPGGAVALAAVLADRVDIRGNTAVIVLSGGNIDESVLGRALAMADTRD